VHRPGGRDRPERRIGGDPAVEREHPLKVAILGERRRRLGDQPPHRIGLERPAQHGSHVILDGGPPRAGVRLPGDAAGAEVVEQADQVHREQQIEAREVGSRSGRPRGRKPVERRRVIVRGVEPVGAGARQGRQGLARGRREPAPVEPERSVVPGDVEASHHLRVA
jgi:hypothetical protein